MHTMIMYDYKQNVLYIKTYTVVNRVKYSRKFLNILKINRIFQKVGESKGKYTLHENTTEIFPKEQRTKRGYSYTTHMQNNDL